MTLTPAAIGRIAALGLLAALLQLTAASQVSVFGVPVDVSPLIVASVGFLTGSIPGAMLGFGFGLFGELSRGEAWLLVPVVWAIMLLWSKPWLDRYRYGPFEWAWRSLSRWKWEPMRKRASAEIPATA